MQPRPFVSRYVVAGKEYSVMMCGVLCQHCRLELVYLPVAVDQRWARCPSCRYESVVLSRVAPDSCDAPVISIR